MTSPSFTRRVQANTVPMRCVHGIGNPGSTYDGTRHNLGFAVVDEIARRHGCTDWQRKWSSLVCAWRLPQTLIPADGDDHALLIKPQTFVNLSGEALQAVLAFHKISASDILVVVDDLTLPLGDLRLRPDGSAGGHNGLRDIDAHVGKDYRRVRIGIGHPGHKDLVLNWVLRDFEPDERDDKTGWVPKLLGALAEESALLAEGGQKADEKYMSRVAALAPPPDLPARLDIKE